MQVEEIAQWVVDNRYPKSENNKVSDSEMYYTLIEKINQALTIPDVSKSVNCDDCNGEGERWSAYYSSYVKCDCKV